MTTFARGRRDGCLAALAMAALVGGCYADGSTSSSVGGVETAGGGGGAGVPASNPTQPMLVVVDTGQTLSAQGGQGVGIFTEYAAGGHWHVWWTCDTSVTGLDCAFDVTVSAAGGAAADTSDGGVDPGVIGNVLTQIASSGSQVLMPTASTLDVTTTTFTTVDGVRFDTAPGATITLTASVNGARNGAFLFFVQDGAVNGGYQGTLSDPLMLVPSSP